MQTIYWKRLAPAMGLSIALALGFISCGESPAPPASKTRLDGVARVGEVVISEESFKALLARRGGGSGPEQKQALLEELLRTEALYAKAVQAGFDRSPEMTQRLKRLVAGEFKEQQFKPVLAVSDAELQAAYERSAARFSIPEAARGAMIFFKASAKAGEQQRGELRRQAEAVLAEARGARSDSAFALLVQRHSEDQATRYTGGDLGWLIRSHASAPGAEAAVFDALFALQEPGQLAPLVETPAGFYIIRLLERRAAGRRSLAEVREFLRHQLTREKQQQAERDFFAGIKAGLDIQINYPALEKLSDPGSEDAPPALPGAATAHARSFP